MGMLLMVMGVVHYVLKSFVEMELLTLTDLMTFHEMQMMSHVMVKSSAERHEQDLHVKNLRVEIEV